MDTIEISNVINQNIRTDWVSWPCLAIILPQKKRATYCRKIFCLVSHVSKMIWSPTCVSRMAFNWLGLIYECVIFYIVILKTVIKCFTLRIPGNLFVPHIVHGNQECVTSNFHDHFTYKFFWFESYVWCVFNFTSNI